MTESQKELEKADVALKQAMSEVSDAMDKLRAVQELLRHTQRIVARATLVSD